MMKNPSIIYHIFPDRFCRKGPEKEFLSLWSSVPKRDSYFGGNLSGIISKLDYIVDLGVQTLYLTPIFEANSNHRYNTKNYYNIDPLLGNEETFELLINKLHSNNISIILDGVYNHCGTDFFAFKDVLKNSKYSEYKDWFIIKKFPVRVEKGFYQCWKNHPQLVEFNFNNEDLRKYILKQAKYWTSKGIDGWRLDAPERIPKDFWCDFVNTLREYNKNLIFIGEIWEKADEYLEFFDGVTNYQFRENVLNFVLGKKTAEKFSSDFISYYSSYGLAHTLLSWNLIGSHDTPRIFTLFKGKINKVKLAIALQFALPGSPIIYYGDEIGLRGTNDPYCRGTFKWNKSYWNKDIFHYYKNMIKLWKSYQSLMYGTYKAIYYDDKTLIFEREYDNEKIIVAITTCRKAKVRLPLSVKVSLLDDDFNYHDNLLEIKYGAHFFLV